jgi:hypothetical protein
MDTFSEKDSTLGPENHCTDGQTDRWTALINPVAETWKFLHPRMICTKFDGKFHLLDLEKIFKNFRVLLHVLVCYYR